MDPNIYKCQSPALQRSSHFHCIPSASDLSNTIPAHTFSNVPDTPQSLIIHSQDSSQPQNYSICAEENYNCNIDNNLYNSEILPLSNITNQLITSQSQRSVKGFETEHVNKRLKIYNAHSKDFCDSIQSSEDLSISNGQPGGKNDQDRAELHGNIVYNLLKKSYKGALIFAAYDYDVSTNGKHNKFEKYSYKLANIIVENDFNNGKQDFYRERYMFLRDQVVEVFPKFYLPQEWFTPSDKKHSAKGKLYMAYRNLRSEAI